MNSLRDIIFLKYRYNKNIFILSHNMTPREIYNHLKKRNDKQNVKNIFINIIENAMKNDQIKCLKN